MKYLLTGIAIATVALSGAARAHDDHHDHDHHDEERVIHYAVEAPKNHDAAVALINEKNNVIGDILTKDKLDGNDLEKIHEQTYSIEVAVEKLRDETLNETQESALDSVDEANQALHFASENHEEATSREWYAKLKPAVAALDASFKAK